MLASEEDLIFFKGGAPHAGAYVQDKLDSVSYFFSNLKRGHEVEVGEWEMDLEGVRGGIMDNMIKTHCIKSHRINKNILYI